MLKTTVKSTFLYYMQHFGIKKHIQLWAVLIFMFCKHIALS